MQNYSEVLEFLYRFTPAYHKIGTIAFKPSLEKTYQLDAYFQSPHREYLTVHVGGTNGKGSVSHALAAIFIQSGYKVGLYTSPHLVDFVERIKVNGQPASHDFVVSFVEKHKDIIFKVQPSFFEFTTFMAFEYFKEQNVEVALIEVGMGGRLDTTNIIEPVLSIITNISYDHQIFLGDTLEKIALEKAGIIKRNIPVIIGERQFETDKVFEKIAFEKYAPLYFAEDFIEWKIIDSNFHMQILEDLKTKKIYTTDLTGIYQQKNLKTILVAVENLRNSFPNITDTTLEVGLKNIKKISGLKGRIDFLRLKNFSILIDVGHNIAGISQLLKELKDLSEGNLHFVIGFVSDKDLEPILALFPKASNYYFLKPNIERGLDAKLLQQKAAQHHLNGIVCKNFQETFTNLENKYKIGDLIVICGSCFLVGDFLSEVSSLACYCNVKI